MFRIGLLCVLLVGAWVQTLHAGMTTWDGQYPLDKVAVTVVYFVPKDRTPLPDWRDRVNYYCERIAQFHAREYGTQSTLTTSVLPEPFTSARTTAELRDGDANFIYFRTLEEVHNKLQFGEGERTAFPILLVFSEINWRPLDDFYRLKPGAEGPVFEGNLSDGRHFPGAESGGARAAYLADRGLGWGLVSADGWRVPYSGSDCVVYHEGVGHTVGLPHPEPANRSVMSLAQYHGWISESFLDIDQKVRLGWQAPEQPVNESLFSRFRAVPEPAVPTPHQEVLLNCEWPAESTLRELKVQVQTDLWGPWHNIQSPVPPDGHLPGKISLGSFDRPTPVSYRIEATLQDEQSVELWGYLQVRLSPDVFPLPPEGRLAD